MYTTITVPKPNASGVDVKPGSASQIPYQHTPPASLSYPGVVFPTFSPEKPNPNGPYYNPNNYIPEPITFPGRPTKGAVSPEQPNIRPRPSGGYNAGAYDSPHWCEKGRDLKPGLPQKDTNGNSQWGLIDCPRLPPYLGPGDGYVKPSVTGSSGPYSSKATGVPSSSHGNPFPSYSVSGNATRTSSWISSITSSLPPFSDSCASNNTQAVCAAMPDTGVTRTYNFKVAYGDIAPDGVEKNAILINGQFPGPLIEANWGDWIEVHVRTIFQNLLVTTVNQLLSIGMV